MRLEYSINSKKITVSTSEEDVFFKGEDVCLSSKFDDLTRQTNWYNEGYSIVDYSSVIDPIKLRLGVMNAVKKVIIKTFPEINVHELSLEKYHKFVTHDQQKVIDKLVKRLYPIDFGFDDKEIISFIENQINRPLTYDMDGEGSKHWIIVRINMPGTKAFNPVHKDIYELLDQKNIVPRMINCWIPICGVNSDTGLPIVPRSHLLKESDIVRTACGSTIEGQKYSVNCIKSWDNRNNMTISSPKFGSMLLFSSHLIHGLGVNNNLDETRIALEFRLHLDSNR